MFQVDTADPAFPRPAGYWWFGCKAESSGKSDGKGWFLTGSSYPGLSGAEVGDTSRTSYRGDDADPHSSDVDDLILDAGEEGQRLHDLAKALLPTATSTFYWLSQLLRGLTDLSVGSNSDTEWIDVP